MKLNEMCADVQAHWADNLLFVIKFYRNFPSEECLVKEYIKQIEQLSISDCFCAYCLEFKDSDDLDNDQKCVYCPVYKSGGYTICRCTPYEDVKDVKHAIRDWLLIPSRPLDIPLIRNLAKALIKAVWEEYLFLKNSYYIQMEKGKNDG